MEVRSEADWKGSNGLAGSKPLISDKFRKLYFSHRQRWNGGFSRVGDASSLASRSV
jgi:hypothetical protein